MSRLPKPGIEALVRLQHCTTKRGRFIKAMPLGYSPKAQQEAAR